MKHQPVAAASRLSLPEGRQRRLQWELVLGFALMIVLLGADGIGGFKSILSVRESVSRLTGAQFQNVVLIDEVQRVQSSLGSVLYKIGTGEAASDRKRLEEGVNRIEQSFRQLFAGIPADDPDIDLWRAVEKASVDATIEADRVLELSATRKPDLTRLMACREQLLSSTSTLIRANHDRAEATRKQIEEITSNRLTEDATLLSLCLVIAVASAWFVLRMVSRQQQQITEHATELGRVSWQLLERQENLARRLSHELHDELGQSLTALKTNFSRFQKAQTLDPNWIEDCNTLLRESIRSAHEISQLLRPTILDDFGLDSALRWLCERFEERNRIEVQYQSDLNERLDAQTETHVFRIAQEALTNIARHARASKVTMSLSREDASTIRLFIRDNGVGIGAAPKTTGRFGVTGMRARARSLEGAMRVHSEPGRGTEIEVVFPWKAIVDEEENAHLVG